MRLGKLAIPLCLLVACPACDSTSPISDAISTDRTLELVIPPDPDVGLTPGSQQMLKVLYMDEHLAGIPDAQVRFAIFGDPRGSTLSSDTAITDRDGQASVQVRAGAVSSRFQVRVSAPHAKEATYYIVVSDAGFGSLLVGTSYAGAVPEQSLVRIVFNLNGDISCSSIDFRNPPPHLRSRVADGIGKQVAFQALPLNQDHALTVLGYVRRETGDWQLRATGCAEVPAGVLRANHQLSFTILINDLAPQLKGSYAIVSRLSLPQANRPLADALRPWMDLANCPLDPAQLLLDCLLDALDPADPLDCKISSPSAETQALLDERGLLVDSCRMIVTPRGTPSIDKLIANAMQISSTPMMPALIQLGTNASIILSKINLSSTLDILSLDENGRAVLRHQIDSVTFYSKAEQTTYKMVNVGLPFWLASPIQGTLQADGWKLSIEEHSLSLRLGMLSLHALGDLVLSSSGLPTSSSELVAHLMSLVQYESDLETITGCEAIDLLACKAARLDKGCLLSACANGVKAFVSYLDSSFLAMDTMTKDLVLQGEVTVLDIDGDLAIDKLGTETEPGSWSARLNLGSEVIFPTKSAFTGERR